MAGYFNVPINIQASYYMSAFLDCNFKILLGKGVII